MFDSFQPHGLQHTSFPCLSPTPGACSNSCPLSRWCHPTISSSIMSFFSFLQSFPASGSFPMSQFFASGRQSIRHLPHHSNWVCTLEPGDHNYWDHMQQLLKPECPRAHAPQLEKPPICKEDPSQLYIYIYIYIYIYLFIYLFKTPKQINKWKE